MPTEAEGFPPEDTSAVSWEGVTPAGERIVVRETLPWPPWLEKLTDRERIHAIVRAVAACHESHRGHDDAEAHEQHCSATMAEHFLAKMLGRLVQLENALEWGTSCLSCAAVLDSSIRDHERAERAEGKLAELTASGQAVAKAIAAERQRIRQLAEKVDAASWLDEGDGIAVKVPFARVIDTRGGDGQ
jgi:hypothetical protein